jgi:hypothetical protein
MVIMLLFARDMHATVEELLEAAFFCGLCCVCIIRTKQELVGSWQIAVSNESALSPWLAASTDAGESLLLQAATKQQPVKTEQTEKTWCVL